jgi:hypothetical protein
MTFETGALHLNSLIKLFLDKLSERIFSLIGSSIGTAATTYHAIQQAEQQSVLEDLARKYELDGKLELAAKLREQASLIGNDDPAAAGKHILLKVTEQPSHPMLGLSSQEGQSTPAMLTDRSRRSRRMVPSEDNVTDKVE